MGWEDGFSLLEQVLYLSSYFISLCCCIILYVIALSDSCEPIREGLRKRKKHQIKQPAQPSTSVVWLPEEQLELWEMSAFSERTALNKIEKHDKPKKTKKMEKLTPKVLSLIFSC